MSTPGEPRELSVEEYNYRRFSAGQFLKEARQSAHGWGLEPGAEAPDFELPRVQGGMVTLRALRGMPVLLRFTSYT